MKKKISISLGVLLFTTVGFSQAVKKIEAETFNQASGPKAETNSNLSGTGNVGYIKNGGWIKFNAFEFNKSDSRFDVKVSGGKGNIEFRLDSPTGTLIGTTVVDSKGWQNYNVIPTTIKQTTGTHDLYLVFTGESTSYLFNLDYFEKGI